jgi:hypothetical protein
MTSLFSEDNPSSSEPIRFNPEYKKKTFQQCNKGDNCYYLHKGTCTFQHSYSAMSNIIRMKNRDITQLENILKNSLLPHFKDISTKLTTFLEDLTTIDKSGFKKIYLYDLTNANQLLSKINDITLYFKDTTLKTFNVVLDLLDSQYLKIKSISGVLDLMKSDIKLAADASNITDITSSDFEEFDGKWEYDNESKILFTEDKSELDEISENFNKFLNNL